MYRRRRTDGHPACSHVALSYCYAMLSQLCVGAYFSETVEVPVYSIINPAIGEAVEQNLISELTKAYDIIDVLMETSREVCCLKEQLRQKITPLQRSRCRDRLTKMFLSALDQGGTLPRLVRIFAHMVAYNTVRDIGFGSARTTNSAHMVAYNTVRDIGFGSARTTNSAHMVAYNTVRDIGFGSARTTNRIVIYYRCKTVKALYELSQLDAVFAAAVESLVRRPTTVDVHMRADDFNFARLRLSCPQGTGKSGDRHAQ